MKKLCSIVILGLCLISIPSCTSKTIESPDTSKTSTAAPTIERPRVTIWIHGTHFWFNKLIPGIKKQKKGLSPASSVPEYFIYNKLIARKLSTVDSAQFPYDHFYLFAWSGQLSFQAREEAAQHLHDELNILINEYQTKYGSAPEITLITHSHGGNVALNLAKVKKPESRLAIDRLIMLAVPVQKRTSCFVQDSIFKQVYSFYSKFDSIQILDAQGIYQKTESEMEKKEKIPLFSERLFAPCNNLIQTNMRFAGIGPFHISYILWNFTDALPKILNELSSYHDGNHHHVKIFLKKNTAPHITHLNN